MEKYLKIIKSFVIDPLDYQKVASDFDNLYNFPDKYIEESSRLISRSDDFLWLGMVDLLIKYGYAFEVDWKEDCEVVEELLSKLLAKQNIQHKSVLDIEKDMELDHYFALFNNELTKQGTYRVCTIEIDSDSYVSVVSKFMTASELGFLDKRIHIY